MSPAFIGISITNWNNCFFTYWVHSCLVNN